MALCAQMISTNDGYMLPVTIDGYYLLNVVSTTCKG